MITLITNLYIKLFHRSEIDQVMTALMDLNFMNDEKGITPSFIERKFVKGALHHKIDLRVEGRELLIFTRQSFSTDFNVKLKVTITEDFKTIFSSSCLIDDDLNVNYLSINEKASLKIISISNILEREVYNVAS